MAGVRASLGAALLALAAASASCGDSDSGGGGEGERAAARGGETQTEGARGGETQTQAATTARPRPPKPDPPRPLYPSCGLEAFGRPQVGPGTGGRGWRLTYRHPRPQQAVAVGATSQVDIEERPPEGTPPRYANARILRVRGREVEIARPRGGRGGGGGLSIARWTTKRARYVAFIDGKRDTTLRKIVACSP